MENKTVASSQPEPSLVDETDLAQPLGVLIVGDSELIVTAASGEHQGLQYTVRSDKSLLIETAFKEDEEASTRAKKLATTSALKSRLEIKSALVWMSVFDSCYDFCVI
jgi:hypothetical protein